MRQVTWEDIKVGQEFTVINPDGSTAVGLRTKTGYGSYVSSITRDFEYSNWFTSKYTLMIENDMKEEVITKETLQSGYKADNGKARFSLIPPIFLKALADLFAMGARKYSDWNWFLGMKYSRVYDAMLRHANAWANGETNDPVDGQHHLISVAWNACVLFVYDSMPDKFKKFDDRLHNIKDEDILENINTGAKK